MKATLWIIVLLCCWCFVASMGGEFTRSTARDLAVALLVFVLALSGLTLLALYE